MNSLPTPDYILNGADLYCNDTMAVLNSLPNAIFDVIFADPPYNLSNDGTTCHAGRRVSVNKGDWDKSKGIDDDLDFTLKWISACKRVLKDEGTLWISGTYHNIFTCGYALLKGNWHILNDIIWYKPNAAPNLACRMFTASHETLIWAKKNRKAKHFFNYELMKSGDWSDDRLKGPGKQMRSVWSVGFPKDREKAFGKHPTQKPLDLLIRIMKASCPEGGLVLDPFCGSGTTGVAALLCNASFVGIDAERGYLENIALPRLREAREMRDGKGGSDKDSGGPYWTKLI